ncbi:MAG: hypothetical protein ACXWZY_08975 [Gaiellaceae bacterium]
MNDGQKERLARNEDLFRSVNEEIERAAESQGIDSHEFEFFCECSDRACTEKVVVTLAEYSRARANSKRFIVVKGHVIQEIEHVVDAAEDHVLIEKHGHAGVVAIELDKKSR